MIKRLAAVAILVSFAGCERHSAVTAHSRWPVMGTVAAVSCADPTADTEQLRQTADEIYRDSISRFSAWTDGSELAKINASGTNWVAVSEEMAKLVEISIHYAKTSGGAFSPLVSPLLRVWGFGWKATPPDAPPDGETVRKLAATARWENLSLNRPALTLRFTRPDAQLDLGGIAKGYAVDKVWERFRGIGVTNALVDLGGNLRCLGEAAPGRGGWRTAVRDPLSPAPGYILGTFLLRPGEAVATSGNYERFVTIAGKRYAHIIDPRTGRPAEGVLSCTVIADTAVAADALSTTLFVLGSNDGKEYLRKHAPDCAALWVTESGEQILSDNFQTRNLQPARAR